MPAPTLAQALSVQGAGPPEKQGPSPSLRMPQPGGRETADTLQSPEIPALCPEGALAEGEGEMLLTGDSGHAGKT